jgi:hypothetical protein
MHVKFHMEIEHGYNYKIYMNYYLQINNYKHDVNVKLWGYV